MAEQEEIVFLLDMAWSLSREGRYEKATQYLEKAHELCRNDDHNTLGRIFHIYMQFEADQNKVAKALDLCQKSLSHYNKSGNLHKIAHSMRHVADLQMRMGRLMAAEKNYRTAIGLYRDLSSPTPGNLANALRGFGILLEKLNKTQESISVWRETKSLYAACQLEAGVDEADDHLDALAKLAPPK